MVIGHFSIENISRIKTLPIFNQLDETDIKEMSKLNDIINIIVYEPKETLIIEGRMDRKMFLMIHGHVILSRDTIAGNSKSTATIQTIEGKGNFFGEISAFTGRPRTATVTALSETACVVIDIDALMRQSSSLAARIKSKLYPPLFEMVCKRLGDTDEMLAKTRTQNAAFEQENTKLKQELRTMEHDLKAEIADKRIQIRILETKRENLDKKV